MDLLNIGCGNIVHSDWINIDIASNSPDVKIHDLRKGLPYSDTCFDACYSSHVLEHLIQDEAKHLLSECFRTLKSGGIIRVVVPDLEAIARTYLALLEEVESGNPLLEANYDWIMLEFYDQVVRSYVGGDMGNYLNNPDLINQEFVVSRMGSEVEAYWHSQVTESQTGFLQKLTSKNLSWWIQKIRIEIAKLFVFLIAGQKERLNFEEGLFRSSGEIHRWMYDRFSLGRLLKKAGFINVQVCQADSSLIPNFDHYNLDMVDGKVRKPDSLFMEAVKP